MTIQLGTTERNAMLDAFEISVGTSARLKLYTGSQPVDCATTSSGTLLVDIACPSDWMAAASGGSKAKSGTWSNTATGTGTAGYWRIYDSASGSCRAQGSITATGGGGDMTLDNVSIASGQTVTVNTFTFTAGNP